jgi:hypothetical protein
VDNASLEEVIDWELFCWVYCCQISYLDELQRRRWPVVVRDSSGFCRFLAVLSEEIQWDHAGEQEIFAG